MNIYETFDNLRYHHENEVVEFKKAENSFDFNELGKYFSALSNEANLRDKGFAWLVFGVHDKTREILGTTYKNSMKSLQKLKYDLSQHTTDRNTFRDIYELPNTSSTPWDSDGLAGTFLCPTRREFGGSRHEQI